MQSFKKIGIKLYHKVPTVYILRSYHKVPCVYIYMEVEKMTKVEKVTKNNLRIISKEHAHLHTMKKTHAKFQNDQYKTVRGVALKTPRVNVDEQTNGRKLARLSRPC